MSTTFDDIPFGVETGRAASYTDWQIETRDRSEMVPYSNILITEHIGYAPAQVTWRLHFYRRDDYFAFLAKLRTVGTLKVHVGLQSLKGTQVTLGNPPRVYELLDNVKIAEIRNQTLFIDGGAECDVTFERMVDPITREAVVL